jgi:hypothetical protein
MRQSAKILLLPQQCSTASIHAVRHARSPTSDDSLSSSQRFHLARCSSKQHSCLLIDLPRVHNLRYGKSMSESSSRHISPLILSAAPAHNNRTHSSNPVSITVLRHHNSDHACRSPFLSRKFSASPPFKHLSVNPPLSFLFFIFLSRAGGIFYVRLRYPPLPIPNGTSPNPWTLSHLNPHTQHDPHPNPNHQFIR